MSEANLLIVEDELDLRDMLEYALSADGYQLSTAGNGSSAWQSMSRQPPNLVLLDWMLPDISGIELLRRMRRTESLKDVPVIMLTARGEEEDRVRGLDSGADDYVVKPFSMKELQARVRSQLRHFEKSPVNMIKVDGLELDEDCHRVMCGDCSISIGPTEFRLLSHFMRHAERVYSRDQLLDSVWGNEAYLDERTVDVHIRRLRKALEVHDKAYLIQTVHGVGYRFSVKH